jgi:hypothetical protein
MGAFAHLGTDEDILIISRAPPDASKVLCFYFHVGYFQFFYFSIFDAGATARGYAARHTSKHNAP